MATDFLVGIQGNTGAGIQGLTGAEIQGLTGAGIQGLTGAGEACIYGLASYFRHEDFRPSVTFRVAPTDSETERAGKLRSNTNLLKWQN